MVSPPFAEEGMPAKQAACLPDGGTGGRCAPVFKADGGQQWPHEHYNTEKGVRKYDPPKSI